MVKRMLPKVDMVQLELPSQDMGLNQDMDSRSVVCSLDTLVRGLLKVVMVNRECSQAMEFRDLMDCKQPLHLRTERLNQRMLLLAMVCRDRDNLLMALFLQVQFNLVISRQVLLNNHMVSQAQP